MQTDQLFSGFQRPLIEHRCRFAKLMEETSRILIGILTFQNITGNKG